MEASTSVGIQSGSQKLETSDDQQEVQRQDEYLQEYNLYRTDIVGDGNCLYRAISFCLYGTEVYHSSLRKLAVDHIEQNVDDFRFYLCDDPSNSTLILEGQSYLASLRQPGSFAGQESILALSKVLSINILVTIGGDSQNPQVKTLEHNLAQSPNIVHLVWTRSGGGHYEAVVLNRAATTSSEFRGLPKNPLREKMSNYQWKSNADTCKPFQLQCLQNIKDKNREAQEEDHSYVEKQHNVLNSECPKCKRQFFNKSTMVRHLKSYHENEKKICCSFSTCSLTFSNVEALVDHLKSFHDANIEIENLEFDNLDSFAKFKEMESTKTNTRYVKRRQNKINKDGSQSFTIVCHRDGLKRDHLKKGETYRGKRKANIKGSCKIEKLCPSRMSVSVKADGSVKVRYIKSHTHSTGVEESRFLPIPEWMRSEICTMLSLKMPISSILDTIRENVSNRSNLTDSNNMEHYPMLGRKSILNLKRAMVDSLVDRHQRGLEIDNGCIVQISAGLFRITSKDSTCTIQRLADSCKENSCFNKCEKFPCVKLCIHLFSCSCQDYLDGNVCEHLHKMQEFYNQNYPISTDDCDEESNLEYTSGCNESDEQCSTRDSTTRKMNQIQNRLKKISEQVKNDTSVQEHRLDSILSALDHIISTNESSSLALSTIKKLKKSDKKSSNAEQVLQRGVRPAVKKSYKSSKTTFRKRAT